MIKLNFEFDSKDSVSSQLYEWLSACPLDQSRLKITTSVDYIDPKTNKPHRVGNIILDMTPEEAQAPSASSASQSGDTEPKAKHKPIIFGQKSSSKKEDRSKKTAPTDQKADQSKEVPIDQKDGISKKILVNDPPASPEPPTVPKLTFSFDSTFESGFDESILAAVAFADDENTPKASDPDQTKDKTEAKAEKPVPAPESKEDDNAAPNPAASDSDSASVALKDEDRGSEDYDFLLNSLDEFNA